MYEFPKGGRKTMTVGDMLVALKGFNPATPVMAGWEGQLIGITPEQLFGGMKYQGVTVLELDVNNHWQ